MTLWERRSLRLSLQSSRVRALRLSPCPCQWPPRCEAFSLRPRQCWDTAVLQGRWFGASKGKVNWRTEIRFSLHLPLLVVVMFSIKCIWCNVLYIVVIRLELFWYIHASRKVADVHWGVGCRWFKEIAFSQWMALGCPRRSFFSWSFSPLWWLLVRNAARSEGWAWPMQRTCWMQRICCCPPFKSWFLGSINQECFHLLNNTFSQCFQLAGEHCSWSHGCMVHITEIALGPRERTFRRSLLCTSWILQRGGVERPHMSLSLMLTQGSWMFKVTKYLYLRL